MQREGLAVEARRLIVTVRPAGIVADPAGVPLTFRVTDARSARARRVLAFAPAPASLRYYGPGGVFAVSNKILVPVGVAVGRRRAGGPPLRVGRLKRAKGMEGCGEEGGSVSKASLVPGRKATEARIRLQQSAMHSRSCPAEPWAAAWKLSPRSLLVAVRSGTTASATILLYVLQRPNIDKASLNPPFALRHILRTTVRRLMT